MDKTKFCIRYCPFCEGQAELVETEQAIKIVCKSCGAKSKSFFNDGSSDKQAVLLAWNRRETFMSRWVHKLRKAVGVQQLASTRKTRKIRRLKATIKQLESITNHLAFHLQDDYDCFTEVIDLLGRPDDAPVLDMGRALESFKKFKADRRGNK